MGLVSWVWLWPLSAGFEATCLDAAASVAASVAVAVTVAVAALPAA